MLPEEVKPPLEKDQGPGTRLVLKGLKRALPSIAERNEQHLRKREPAPEKGRGEGPLLIFFSLKIGRPFLFSTMLTLYTTRKNQAETFQIRESKKP